MKTTAAVFMAVFLGLSTAMAQRTGTVTESKSKIDGERQVHIVPGWLKGDGLLSTSFLVGGFWSDKSPTNFILQVVILDSGVPERLRVAIDGQITELAADDATGQDWRSGDVVGTVRRFKVPLAFVETMLKGTKVVMDVATSAETKQEGTLVGGANMAKSGFRKGLEKIKNSK